MLFIVIKNTCFEDVINIKTKINDLEINYLKKGEGKAVLILPGWGTTIETYMPLINNISTYRTVYCLDMPGFGSSAEPKQAWDLDDFVSFILNFIKMLGIQELDLIGHSNGGRIIIKLMNSPSLNIKIENIILIGSAGIVHSISLVKKFKIKFFKLCKRIIELKPIKLVFPNLLNDLKNKFGSEDYKNASPIMKECLVKLVSEDLREYMPNIKVPTLLIWGENDTAAPILDAEIMEKLIPNSGLVKVENCSHYVFLERSNFVNNVINNFLTRGDSI